MPYHRHERVSFCWVYSSWLSKLQFCLRKVIFYESWWHKITFCEQGKNACREEFFCHVTKNPYREQWLDFWSLFTHKRYSFILQYFMIYFRIFDAGAGPRLSRPRRHPTENFQASPRRGLNPANIFSPRLRRGLRPGWIFRPRRVRGLPGPDPGPRQTLKLPPK